MSERTILVIGGAGYVGSHAAKALAAAGFRPVVYDNFSTGNRWAVRWGPLVEGDMLDAGLLEAAFARHRPLGVMLFAGAALVGQSMREPGLFWRQNLQGALEVLDACGRHGRPPVVFSSTCAVFGEPECALIDETLDKRPINPYGASKLAVERMLEDHDMAHGQRHAILRYFNAAGADPDGEIGESRLIETHLIPLAVEAALGRRPPLKLFGDDFPTADGTAVRDYVHVADLARAHVAALEQLLAGGPSMALNLGSGRGHSVKEIVEGLARVAGQPVPHEAAPRRAGDPPSLVADPRAARERLGFPSPGDAYLDDILRTAWRWGASRNA